MWYSLHFSDNTPEEPAVKKQETMVHEVAAKIEAERKAWRDAVNRSNQRSGQPQRAKDNTSKQ
ncbi:cold-shock DNA-binding domain protein [Neisseria flavescens]|nr:cold-shock DNA-binding domain protein [Neisseria flavescens]